MSNCKVLFFALDSADPDLLLRCLDDGLLPNLGAFRTAGRAGRLETPRALGSDAIWPSVFTGLDPSKHGRYHHKQDEVGSYRLADQRHVEMRRDPIWKTLSDAGRRVAVLDMPKAPLLENFDGFQLLDWHSHYSYPNEFRTWPPEQAEAFAATFGDHITCPCLAARYQEYDPTGEKDKIAGLQRTVDETLAMLLHQLDSGPWDLIMTAFGASHCVGHQFWHLHDRTHPRGVNAGAGAADPVRAIYAAIDAAFGKLLSKLDDETAVVVFAGAGMGPNYVRREMMDEILVRLDRGPPSASRDALKSLKSLWYRVPKGWRKRLSGVAHLAENTLTSRDRSQRRFFATQANDTVGGVRINLKGREPNGRVDPGEFDATCNALIEGISEIRIDDSGAALATDVVRADEIYDGPHLGQLPDILIEWNHQAPIHSISSAAIGTIHQQRLPDWSGTHRAGALAMIRTPGGAVDHFPPGASVYDIAPTLAALCGLELTDVDGKSLVRRNGGD